MPERLSDEERAALRERQAELRRSSKRGAARKAEEARACEEKIAALPEPDRTLAERIDRIVRETAPELEPRTWYGMPAYARDGKVLCFFQPASKFKARYATFGFTDQAQLDEGNLWPTAFAVTAIGPGEEAQLRELLQTAVKGEARP